MEGGPQHMVLSTLPRRDQGQLFQLLKGGGGDGRHRRCSSDLSVIALCFNASGFLFIF